MSRSRAERRECEPSRSPATWLLGPVATLVTVALPPAVLPAQTDYFNLDAERPVAIEDASPLERYAFELQIAPMRIEGEQDGTKTWSVAPELSYGILPRTDVSLHLPVMVRDGNAEDDDVTGIAGLELTVFHNLTLETLTLPALAVSGAVTLPVGGLAGESTRGSLKAIATRSFTGPRKAMRIHGNAEIGFGERATVASDDGIHWRAGVAVDKTFVFQSLLIVGDVYAERPLVKDAETRWIAGAGIRYQVGPQFGVDVGVERRLVEEGPDWALTVGMANSFAIRSLMPIGGRK